jgi:hypothetical protein
MRSAAAAVCAALLAVACGGSDDGRVHDTAADTVGGGRTADSDTAAGTVAPDMSTLPDGCEGLEYSILRTAPNRAALARTFGEPDSLHADTEPNRHVPDATDSLFTVFYPGITVDIRKPAGGDMATHVDLRDNRYIAFPAIGVGASATRVAEALGEPTRRTNYSLVYDCGMHVEQPVTFHLDGRGVVDRIAIDYYVD